MDTENLVIHPQPEKPTEFSQLFDTFKLDQPEHTKHTPRFHKMCLCIKLINEMYIGFGKGKEVVKWLRNILTFSISERLDIICGVLKKERFLSFKNMSERICMTLVLNNVLKNKTYTIEELSELNFEGRHESFTMFYFAWSNNFII
jgi:hypothetical protein